MRRFVLCIFVILSACERPKYQAAAHAYSRGNRADAHTNSHDSSQAAGCFTAL